jgi:osmoprotectant transport system permease protein
MTPGEPLIRWEWIASHLPDIFARLQQHILLAVIAVLAGLCMSLGLGLLVRWQGRLYDPIAWITGALYTVPSLALFAVLIPFTGLSVLTAEIGLVGYTLLILTRGVVGGLRSVPADVRETAVAMGFTPRQLLVRVELPLAVPVLLGAIRVATVSTIGLVTVTALIGQGGFGYFILEGILRFFSTPLIVGALGSLAIGVIADAALVQLQRRLTPWLKER